MSCGPCNCEDCQDERMEEEEPMPPVLEAAPIHRPTWQDAEPANEEQARVWGSVVDRTLKDYGRINMPAAIAIVLGECHVRPENYTRVGLQVERFLRESSSFQILKDKNGGFFKSEPINPNNYTCKGCGNEKLSTMEKSCWKCGRKVGT